ncbi:alpha/beta fold hydrolase [Enemella sp. A6]|uniref:alpha/beta fold hydrolase n=1 Tax=Enemella sp. A6 TaxID=3440152 RepID=UPI003EBE1DE9
MTDPQLRYAYVDTPLGQLHYAEAGEGTPMVLLHQTPRSLDEFADVQPGLARNRRTLAMDMYGFGMSAKPAGPQSIETYAEGVFAFVDALGLDEFVLFGHHTGAFVATEVAAAAPERIRTLVVSGTAYGDEAYRAQDVHHQVDNFPVADDGSHLQQLWDFRAALYPKQRPDILNRFIRDALAPGVNPSVGHVAVAHYRMEDRLANITAPVLVLAPTDDPASYPFIEPMVAALTRAESVQVVDIDGGTIPLMEHKPDEVVSAVNTFLDGLGC